MTTITQKWNLLSILLSFVAFIVLLIVVYPDLDATRTREAAFIASIQGNEATKIFFMLIAELGEASFYLLVFVIVWSFSSPSTSLRWFALVVLASIVTMFLKSIFREARPNYWSQEVEAVVCTDDFGMPSGHALVFTTIFWLAYDMTVNNEKPFFHSPLGLLLVFAPLTLVYALVLFSRLVLAVHFVYQVVAGAIIGFLLLGVHYRVVEVANDLVCDWLQQPLWRQFVRWFAFGALACLLPEALIYAAFSSAPVPREWVANRNRVDNCSATFMFANGTQELFGVMMLSGIVMFGGSFFAVWHRFAERRRFVGHWWQTSALKRFLRFLLNAAGAFLIYFSLGAVPEDNTVVLLFGRYLPTSALISLWLFLLAPLLCFYIRLLNTAEVSDDDTSTGAGTTAGGPGRRRRGQRRRHRRGMPGAQSQLADTQNAFELVEDDDDDVAEFNASPRRKHRRARGNAPAETAV